MKKIALIFPGQGSQYIGMGRVLCENYDIANRIFEEAGDALGFDLKKLCIEGNFQELTRTENTQPAILTASVAAYKVYMQEYGMIPSFCAGHSLGEFSALTCVNAIGFTDAVKIVRARGQFMQEAASDSGAMAAISNIDTALVEEVCSRYKNPDNIAVISNYNSPVQVVISGHKTAVTEVGNILAEKGARVVPLNVSAPFHSPLMQPAADKLAEELKKYNYNPLKYPVISNVTALPYTSHESIIENLTMQMVQPVRWQESMEFLTANKIELAIELGPQAVLRNLMKKNAPEIMTLAFDKEEDINLLKSEWEAENKKKGNAPTVITKCLAIAVCTQNRNWNNEEYQKGVIEPYRNIQKLQEEIEMSGQAPTIEQMTMALDMLSSVFITKKTPAEEQIERFNQVFDETGTRSLFPNFSIK